MTKLNELAKVIIALIRIGTVARVSYCFLLIITNEDEVPVYKKRIKNAIGYLILAEGIWKLVDLVYYYFPISH